MARMNCATHALGSAWGSLEETHHHRLAMNAAVGVLYLIRGDVDKRGVVDRFDEAVAQCVQHRAEGANVFGGGKLFMRLRTNGAIIHDGARADR